jgi:hypothetical protein
MLSGSQVTPGGALAAGQVTITEPTKPPLGVTVIVEVFDPPAETLAADPLAVKLPPWVTVRGKAEEIGDAA